MTQQYPKEEAETIVEWFCKYTYLSGPNAGKKGYSVSPTRDLAWLRVHVAKHNAKPNRHETLEIWRKTTVEQPET